MRWKTLGPTAGTADTETRVGAADFEFPSDNDWTIKKIKIGYGHVVDAKSPVAVFELKINTLAGPFRFVIGKGAGSDLGGQPRQPETIKVNIPIAKSSKVGAYVTFADAATDVTVSLGYTPGKNGRVTYSDMPALTASLAADTLTSLGSITTKSDLANVTLKSIRFGMGQVVAAKAATAKVVIKGVPNIDGDTHLTMMFGNGTADAGGATSSPGPANAEEEELDIGCPGNNTLTVYATAAEAAVETGYSIMYE